MTGAFDARLEMLRCVTAEVGAFALGRFHRLAHVAVETKGIADYVSAVDREAETLGRRLIRLAYPHDSIVGEEHAGEAAAEYWLIDPIDGTANFLSGIPFWAVSIAYVRDGEPVLGAIALPALDALFWSALDGPLHGSGALPQLPSRRPMAFGIGRNRVWKLEHRLQLEARLEAQGFHITNLGSCAGSLAMVAAGRLAGYVEHGTNLWDCAAGHILCKTAGRSSTITFDETGLVAVQATMAPLAQSATTT
ncbi:inositol monophosphatase family protein [Sinorhizobium medicae]|uniref:inositol monophosphatase family protein n=1 Tax=Sinorhizobium medicae TaxID=110321 RepID=UPI001F1E85BA|nr:inositol monophosphatase family protein [Sinorhizobium medicae]